MLHDARIRNKKLFVNGVLRCGGVAAAFFLVERGSLRFQFSKGRKYDYLKVLKLLTAPSIFKIDRHGEENFFGHCSRLYVYCRILRKSFRNNISSKKSYNRNH